MIIHSSSSTAREELSFAFVWGDLWLDATVFPFLTHNYDWWASKFEIICVYYLHILSPWIDFLITKLVSIFKQHVETTYIEIETQLRTCILNSFVVSEHTRDNPRVKSTDENRRGNCNTVNIRSKWWECIGCIGIYSQHKRTKSLACDTMLLYSLNALYVTLISGYVHTHVRSPPMWLN